MAVTVNEKYESRETSLRRHVRIYTAQGSHDPQAVIAAVAAVAPAAYSPGAPVSYMSLTEIRAEPVHIDTGNESGCRWLVNVEYSVPSGGGSRGKNVGDEAVTTFNTGGGTVHKQFSIATRTSKSIPGVVTPDFKGAIDVEFNGVSWIKKGTDIVAPAFQWSETAFLSPSTVTEAYRKTLMELTGTVNNAGFRGFEAGEVLFMGASGTVRGDGNWEITYSFAAKKNQTDWADLGDDLKITFKGWDFVWALYRDKAEAKDVGMLPESVYAEQVYRETDFSQITLEET